MSPSNDHLVVETGQWEKAGVQLANIRSESDAVRHVAEAIHGSIPGPEAGVGVSPTKQGYFGVNAPPTPYEPGADCTDKIS